MSAVQPPRAARGRLRHGLPGDPAAGGSLVLAAVAVLLALAPARTETAPAVLVLGGLLASFSAAMLGWAVLRRTSAARTARRRAALAGTVVGAATVCVLLLQLPDVVLVLSGG